VNVKEAYNPRTVEEALEILQRLKGEKARIVAGGTDLMVFLKEKKIEVSHLVDITGIKELEQIREEGDRLVIGSLVTHHAASEHRLIRSHAPVLIEGCAKVGSPQIRYRATLGGNVCTGSPAGDSLPPLAILGAHFVVKSISGGRIIPFADFFTGPQKTVIRPDELLTAIIIDKMAGGEVASFHWLGTRKALSVTKVSLAGRCRLKEGFIESPALALGSVSPVVKRAVHAENALAGKKLSHEIIEDAVKALGDDATPIDDVRSTGSYRSHIVGVLLARFLERHMKA
jgi:CO/xanthine dehydrogenase FAD-binding subunit